MKNKFLFILLLSVIQIVIIKTNIVSAQKVKPSDVPADVVQTFDEQYSYVKVTGWQKDDDTYIASIKDGATFGKVYLSAAGEWLRTLFTVPTSELGYDQPYPGCSGKQTVDYRGGYRFCRFG